MDSKRYRDPVVEAYMPGVDRTLLRENLKLTVEARARKHARVLAGAMELRRAGKALPEQNRFFDKGHIQATLGPVSATVKSRIDPELKRQAEAVLDEIGLKPRAALELFYKQIIKRRAIPFPVQADSPEDDVLSPAARRNALADVF